MMNFGPDDDRAAARTSCHHGEIELPELPELVLESLDPASYGEGT
jgi:hypothetical protein